MLRVAEFTDNYGPGSNGLTVAVQQLEGNLLDAGHEVIVIAPQTKGVNPHRGRAGRTEIRLPSVAVPRMPTRVANGRKFEKTIDQLGELRPDVIHVHGLGPVGVLGIWAARQLQIPSVLTWHTDFDAYADHYASILPILQGVLRMFATLSRGAVVDTDDIRAAVTRYEDRGRSTASLLGLCAKMLELADIVTTPSPKTATRVAQLCPDVAVRVIPNGVDALPPPDGSPAPVLRGSGPLAVYAGRIAPEKGLLLLAEAFKIVRAQQPDAQLLIVGDYRRYSKIRRGLERLRDEGGVILAGEQPRQNLGKFYGMADYFVFPSQTDTQALVLHEAALAGLPIVSVDHELMLVLEPGVNGELTRPTPASLAAGMMRVIDKLGDAAWRDAASRTSRRLAGQWTITSQAEAMLQVYAEAASYAAVPG